MLGNIRALEVIRLADVKGLGTGTAKHRSRLPRGEQVGRTTTRADPQGSGLRGKRRRLAREGTLGRGDQTALLSLSGLRCP